MAPRKLPRGYVEIEENFQPWIPNNPFLPSIPIKSSFGYGSQAPAGVLRPMALQARPGTTDLSEIARSVNQAIKSSELRAQSSRAVREEVKAPTAKPAKKHLADSPRRRRKREPTPDEFQLHQALREATVSPTKDSNSQKSDPTPSPPIPRTVSTDSSPAADPPLQRRLSVMSNSPNYPLYPSPLQRGGHGSHDIGSPDRRSRESSVDNASVVSWNLERDIHEDDLKRTRPSTHGRNITAPPRRPSGLANLVPDTIEEEKEEDDDDVDYFQQQAQEYLQNLREEEEEMDEALQAAEGMEYDISSGPDEPESEPEIQAEAEAEAMEEQESDVENEGWTTSARTIIPSFFRSEPTLEPSDYLDPVSPRSHRESLANGLASSAQPEVYNTSTSSWKSNASKWTRLLVILLIPLTLAVTFGSGVLDNVHVPSFPTPTYAPSKNESVTVNRLRDQVSRMNDQMSSLSRELGSVRSQHVRESKPSSVASHPIGYPLPIPKVNFLSPRNGAIVDPRQTTPTSESPIPAWKRVVLQMFGHGVHPTMPPVAALAPWEEVGDCWCTTPRNGVSQLSVFLGRDIVPEEVVVEHIPSGASLDPTVAPQDIELWARYRVVPLPSTDSSSSWFSWGSSTPHRSAEPASSREEGLGGYLIPGGESLHDVLMSTLSATNIYEPDSAFSDDPLLGSNFYRVGKMRYDIRSANYVQHFHVNTIVDIPTIRVDKVAFRIKSNWGSNNTCIYRFRLHGHV